MTGNPCGPDNSPEAAAPGLFQRARRWLGHSLQVRLVLVFLLLAVALTAAFLGGARQSFAVGWREAARPLLMDYVDHLAAEVEVDGAPQIERAQAIADRLPITVRIRGPVVNWTSRPDAPASPWARSGFEGAQRSDWSRLLERTTADGHTLVFGLNPDAVERHPRLLGYTLAIILLATWLAFVVVRRLLKPLEAIGAGARRFGSGQFDRPIALQPSHRRGELGQLAQVINTMGQDIHQMLEAKRGLLLAISHELRSPLTRARLHTELLPETADLQPQRQALLADLQEMGQLITDLLESERLAGGHAALQREPTDLPALVAEVVAGLQAPCGRVPVVHGLAGVDWPLCSVDPARLRLLLRNLLHNALRHAPGAPHPPELILALVAEPAGVHDAPMACLKLTVRDHGAGVPPDQLAQMAQPFHRPDSARTRSSGGVGLGLYLCRLVAQAHGGRLELTNAQPGLQVQVALRVPVMPRRAPAGAPPAL